MFAPPGQAAHISHSPTQGVLKSNGASTSCSTGELPYCLVLLLLPLLAIPVFIAFGSSDFFLHHGASIWVQANDAVFNMHGRQCDVLVFGDSTAMTGINPDVVQDQTGFRTCNISVTNSVLAVTDNLTLNHYLSNNERPRVLLVQLSPEDFQRENHVWRRTIYAEGLLELLRHGSPPEARHVLLTHPQETVAFAGYAAGFGAFYAIKDVWFHITHLRPEGDTVIVHNGFFTPPSPARTACAPMPALASTAGADPFSRSIVAEYRTDYGTRSGVVLVNVAPIPSCDENLAVYSSQLNGVTSNHLLPLPISMFNDDRHYTALGSTVVSHLVAAELNEVATQNPRIDDRILPPAGITASLQHVHGSR